MTPRRTVARIVLAVGLGAATLSCAQTAAPATPRLRVEVVQSGLAIPWDIAFLADGAMLYTQRDRKTVTLRLPSGQRRVVLNAPPGIWSGGETGLMSIEAASASPREFITCHGYRRGATHDVRVVRWRLDAARTKASFVRTLVKGLPTSGGRHGGCSLVRGKGQVLYVGTGDAAIGTNPQSLTSGGGKVLRVDSRTGKAWKTNPFVTSKRKITRQIYTYGHRNVQGLARRSDGRIWSVEHGSYRDDEVNLLVKKGNYGWNPVPQRAGDPSYNESVPMTDHRLKGAQQKARWRSGNPTIATSGAAFVKGAAWGSLRGALAVPALKGERLLFLTFSKRGKLTTVRTPAELHGTYGRLRGAVLGPDGALYVTTANGTDDKILRISPRT